MAARKAPGPQLKTAPGVTHGGAPPVSLLSFLETCCPEWQTLEGPGLSPHRGEGGSPILGPPAPSSDKVAAPPSQSTPGLGQKEPGAAKVAHP